MATPLAARNRFRTQTLPLLALGLGVLLARALTHPRFLLSTDAACFVRALDGFDLSNCSPHPPGYVLFILLARVIHYAISNPVHVYLILNIAAQLGSLVLVYRVSRLHADPSTAWWCAAIMMAHPLYWYYGSTTAVYTVEPLVGLAVVALVEWDTRSPSRRLLVLMGVVVGLAGGVRQTTSLFIMPVYGWHLWRRRRDGIGILASLAALAVSSTVWLIPLLSLSGGWTRYRTICGPFFLRQLESSSVFFASDTRLALISIAKAATGWVLLLWPLVLMLAAFVIGKRLSVRSTGTTGPPVILILLWILPAAAFYILFHMGNPGYMLWFLPPVLLYLVTRLPRGAGGRFVMLWPLAVTLAIEVGWYVGSKAPATAPPSLKLTGSLPSLRDWRLAVRKLYKYQSDYTLSGVRLWDNINGSYVRTIQQFQPQEVIVIQAFSRETNAIILSTYLPNYTFLSYKFDTDEWAVFGAARGDMSFAHDTTGWQLAMSDSIGAVLVIDEGPSHPSQEVLPDPSLAGMGKRLLLYHRPTGFIVSGLQVHWRTASTERGGG